MLVEEGGADGEAGGDSPSSSAKLQLVGVLRRGRCSGWLRKRGETARPVALAVSFGGLRSCGGCETGTPGSGMAAMTPVVEWRR